MLDKFYAHTYYPCHSTHKIILEIFPVLAQQKFDRQCSVCGREYVIGAKVLRRNSHGITMTQVDITPLVYKETK